MVEVVPVPVEVVPPGDFVKVHVPVAGRPPKTTLAVAKAQVVWVIVPTVGAVGADGGAMISTLADADDTQPDALVTV